MRVLVVEDEVKIASYIRKGLTEIGYVVDIALDGEEALYRVGEYQYDVIILDVMLPKLNGWQFLQQFRRHNRQTAVLMLTARDDIDDRVKGLEAGADDYLVKPFAFAELVARINVLTRRMQVKLTEKIKVADLEIDLLARLVTRAGKRVELSVKEYNLLHELARNQGKTLSRTQLSEKVWDHHFDSQSNIVEVAIRRLRQKIDEGCSPKLIHTVRGLGYVVEAR